jgi:membrane-anchored protein YejM (alkaline phosphatase superfamily)
MFGIDGMPLAGVTYERRREQLDLIRWMNERQYQQFNDPEILSRVASYEMAYRMQSSVPELTDLKQESKQTLAAYGADPGKPSFANNCLLARRLVERGVRFVQLYDRSWDSHTHIEHQHKRQCDAADQPIAALLKDLRQRGLLDDTLVNLGVRRWLRCPAKRMAVITIPMASRCGWPVVVRSQV